MRRAEQKMPTEQLQEHHLEGPAQEPIEEVAKSMGEGQVVVADKIPAMEKIVFRNQRDPGHPLEFHYASKTHPFKQYKLIDGQSYTLPREVVVHLDGCREHVYKYRRNTEGLPEVYTAGYHSHFACERV